MNNEPCYILRAPDDVLIVILHSTDSINTLISLSSSCRRLRSLFEHFPRQICTSVTNNRLGLYASSDPTNVSKSCFPFRSPPETANPDELRKFVVQDSLRIERLLTFMERTTIWLTDITSVRFDPDDPLTVSEAADFYKIRHYRLVDTTHHKSAFCALIYFYHASLPESRDIRDDIDPPLPLGIFQPQEGCYTLVKMQIREILRQLNVARLRRMPEGRISQRPPAPGGYTPGEIANGTHEIWPLFEYHYMKAMLNAEIIESTEGERRQITLVREKCPHNR